MATQPILTRRDFGWIVVISAFSFFVTSFAFAKNHTLYWDNPFFFTIFRDNLHSLNRFGEFAWWYPHKQMGWPAYYYSLLGQLAFTGPVEILMCSLSWIFGKFGIYISKFHPWVVVYMGFLVPLMVTVGAYLLAQLIFASRVVSYFAAFLAAFSPGVVFNLSDLGFLEPQAYSLFFAAAFLSFIREPKTPNKLWLVLTVFLLATNVNFPLMFWNVLAIPLFLASCFFFSNSSRQRIITSLSSVSFGQWSFLIAGILICAAPSLIVYTQTGELIRSRMGSKIYDFHSLYVGNPLEMFAAGWPGFGFDLDVDKYKLLSPGADHHVGLTYLGLGILPLVFTGFLHGQRSLRSPILFMVICTFAILCLSAFSPIFATLLAWPTPFRTNNHFGDAIYRSGGYLTLIYAACLGLKALIQDRWKARETFAKSMLAWIFITGMVMIGLMKSAVRKDPNFSFYAAMSLFLLIASVWLTQARTKRKSRHIVLGLVALFIVDLTTVVNFHVRNILLSPHVLKAEESPAPDLIGLKMNRPEEYSNSILMLKPFYDLQLHRQKLDAIPDFQLFESVNLQTEPEPDLNKFSKAILAVPSETFSEDSLRSFSSHPSSISPPGKVEVLKRTYNSTKLKVTAERDSLLFSRDAFSKYWEVSAGKDKVPVFRALYNFKAVPVKAGVTELEFSFKPPWVAHALILSYAFLAGFCALTIGLWCRPAVLRQRKGNFIDSANLQTDNY